MNRILITGSSGLVGTALCEKFAREGWEVVGVDKYLRSHFLQEKEADTKGQIQELLDKFASITQYEYNINELDKMRELIKDVDAIVHAAAQVSHPQSLKIPIEDAETNIMGTLNLLNITHQVNPEIPFAFLSSNKVYGDYPNYFQYHIVEEGPYCRYENAQYDSFHEELPIDHCGHTPFGVSKVAADLYCQEYARNFGLKTATFRGGCLVGSNQRPVENHGFLEFFTKQILLRQPLNIYGGGYRVRDNLHATDVADVLFLWVADPRPDHLGVYGKPYNLGGMRQNSVSIFETMDAIQIKTGIKPRFSDADARESDHMWWISDMSKFMRDYPEWEGPKYNLDGIFNELILSYNERYDLNLDLQNPAYFSKTREEQKKHPDLDDA